MLSPFGSGGILIADCVAATYSRPSMAPRTRFTPAIGFILVIAALDVMAFGLIMPVFPQIILDLTGSDEDAGIWSGVMIALWAVAQFLCAPIIGSLSDRYGRRPVILASALGLAADFVLTALAPNLWWLAVGRILGGITSSSFTVTFAYMADITEPEKRSRAFGLIGAAYSAGFIAGPLLGGLLGEIGPRLPFWVAAAMSGLAFLYGLLVIPESLKPELRMPFAWRRANPFGALKLLRSQAELAGLSIAYFFFYFAHHVFSVVFVLYAGERYGWSAWEVGLALAFWGVLDVVVQAALVGPIVRRFGDRATMVSGLLFGSLGLIGLGLAPDGTTFFVAIVVSSLWGLAQPTIMALMTRHVSESEQGQLQGASNSVASVAGIVAPIFFGWIYAMSIGPERAIPHIGAAFIIAGAVLALSALIGLRAGRRGESPADAMARRASGA